MLPAPSRYDSAWLLYLLQHFMFDITNSQVRGVTRLTWRLGQEGSLAPSCSNLRSFGSKCTVLQKVHVTLLGLNGASRSHSATHNIIDLAPAWRIFPPHHYTPGYTVL